jgi:hypothetical protein
MSICLKSRYSNKEKNVTRQKSGMVNGEEKQATKTDKDRDGRNVQKSLSHMPKSCSYKFPLLTLSTEVSVFSSKYDRTEWLLAHRWLHMQVRVMCCRKVACNFAGSGKFTKQSSQFPHS